jgi:hypothetical protein
MHSRLSVSAVLTIAAMAFLPGSSTRAVQISSRLTSNHSHDQFNNTPPTPGSPFFTGTTNSTNGTEYTIGPSNGLTGSIKTPNGPGASPTGSSTLVSGAVTINGNATSAGADLTPDTADDWLDGNRLPAGVQLKFDVSFTIAAANGMLLISASGNTGNGLAVDNDGTQLYGVIDPGETLNISAITTSNPVWSGAPTEAFALTPGTVGTSGISAIRSNTTIFNPPTPTGGLTLSDGTNSWGFGLSTGSVASNLQIANSLANVFSPAGGALPLTLTTDAGTWNWKGFQLSTPVTYDVVPLPTVDADFDNDSDVDGADFLITRRRRWQRRHRRTRPCYVAN